jgi:GT2 family glycosyltransferase
VDISQAAGRPDATDHLLPTFSIVVPTFRRPDALARTLDSLVATDYPPDRFEIIIVDDANDLDPQSFLTPLGHASVPVTFVPGPESGAAGARNTGAERASGKYLVFVDDDIHVPQNHLTAQVETRDIHGACISGADWWEFTPDVAAALRSSPVGRYRLALERSYRKRPAERWTYPIGLATAHLTLSRDVFFELGGFNEAFPRAGVEDWDFCLRAREAGHTLILDSSVLLLHNDTRLTFKQLCGREESRALSVGVLARIRPALCKDAEIVRENGPIQPGDVWRRRVRKRVKHALGNRFALSLLHGTVAICERLLRPEPLLQRLYTAVISVHYTRGFRTGLSSTIDPPA